MDTEEIRKEYGKPLHSENMLDYALWLEDKCIEITKKAEEESDKLRKFYTKQLLGYKQKFDSAKGMLNDDKMITINKEGYYDLLKRCNIQSTQR